jgi:hypothetical protein
MRINFGSSALVALPEGLVKHPLYLVLRRSRLLVQLLSMELGSISLSLTQSNDESTPSGSQPQSPPKGWQEPKQHSSETLIPQPQLQPQPQQAMLPRSENLMDEIAADWHLLSAGFTNEVFAFSISLNVEDFCLVLTTPMKG